MKHTIPLVLLALAAAACTEHECYREHLTVYTPEYVAICSNGFWTDYCVNQDWCSSGRKYTFNPDEARLMDRLSAQCPVLQCVRDRCECTQMISREEVGTELFFERLDESSNVKY